MTRFLTGTFLLLALSGCANVRVDWPFGPDPVAPAADGTPAVRVYLAGTSEAVDVEPRLLAHPGIAYPEMEWRAGVGGTVQVEGVVGVDGAFSGLTVTEGVSPGLDRAALEGARAARFEPARHGGEALPVTVWLHVEFGRRE